MGPIPAMLLLLSIPAAAQDPCTILAAKRSAEVGCHFTAAESIGTVLPDRVFRQLYTYPTRSAAGPPMVPSTVGPETRRAVLLVLHDAAQPWSTADQAWAPRGACPP